MGHVTRRHDGVGAVPDIGDASPAMIGQSSEQDGRDQLAQHAAGAETPAA
jgi:hypothetical protein